MNYKPVSWSVGEGFDGEKLKQMAVNDEVIHDLYLKTALGPLASDTYMDTIDGASITAAPAAWTTIIALNDVFLYPSRWIKINVIVNGASAEDRGTYIPFRVTMDGTEVLYIRAVDGALDAVQKWCSVSGARIMQSVPGYHDFVLQLGNDYASAANDTAIIPLGAKNPTILSIDDIGGNYV